MYRVKPEGRPSSTSHVATRARVCHRVTLTLSSSESTSTSRSEVLPDLMRYQDSKIIRSLRLESPAAVQYMYVLPTGQKLESCTWISSLIPDLSTYLSVFFRTFRRVLVLVLLLLLLLLPIRVLLEPGARSLLAHLLLADKGLGPAALDAPVFCGVRLRDTRDARQPDRMHVLEHSPLDQDDDQQQCHGANIVGDERAVGVARFDADTEPETERDDAPEESQRRNPKKNPRVAPHEIRHLIVVHLLQIGVHDDRREGSDRREQERERAERALHVAELLGDAGLAPVDRVIERPIAIERVGHLVDGG